jgi:hypothetical protein
MVVDVGAQRFLEIQRFDRVGAHGRSALLSLGSLDDLSFVGDLGRPYALSPAYDMLPMAFSPSATHRVMHQNITNL